MSQKLLEVSGISKTYREEEGPVLQEVSLHLEAGQLLALAGESGSGKTTLLRLIAGLEEPDSGSIHLNGEPVAGPSEKLIAGHPDIRVVFQDFRLFPNISVEENIRHALRKYEKGYREQRLRQMLSLTRLDCLKNRLPRMLSGGEQQRAALARALADEPALLLMDEPFSNLDHVLRRNLRREIRDILAGSGCGVIIVTHEPDDALSMADQITLLRAGRVLQQGSPAEIYHQPRTAYAAHFFGRANIIQVSNLLPLLQKEEAGRQLAEALITHRDSALCIRAEDLAASSPGRAHLTGKVRSIRFFGAFEEATLALQEDMQITLLIPPGSLQPGQVTGVHIAKNKWHLIKEE